MRRQSFINLTTISVPSQDSKIEDKLVPLHKVLVHNDDITPYDFVIGVLIRFFKLNAGDAEAITLTAHTSGIALVAVLPLSDAQAMVGHLGTKLEGYETRRNRAVQFWQSAEQALDSLDLTNEERVSIELAAAAGRALENSSKNS